MMWLTSTQFYVDIYIITWYDYMLLLWWWDVMRTRWLLRSTTGSYGLFVVETAYGEITSHSIEAIWEILAREKWLECRHDASPMFNIPESTPVWAQYMYFYFNTKFICNMFSKIYMYDERTLVVPDVVLARRRSGNVFDRSWYFL